MVCKKSLKILSKDAQYKDMSCGHFTIILGGEKDELKGTEDIIC